jgi:hypothetical protein
VYTKINLDPKHVDSTTDRGRVPEQPAPKALQAKDWLDKGREKTGVGDVVGWKRESQEGGEGRRMTSRRYSTQRFYEMYPIFLPICVVAMAVRAMCKCCGKFLNAVRIFVSIPLFLITRVNVNFLI